MKKTAEQIANAVLSKSPLSATSFSNALKSSQGMDYKLLKSVKNQHAKPFKPAPMTTSPLPMPTAF